MKKENWWRGAMTVGNGLSWFLRSPFISVALAMTTIGIGVLVATHRDAILASFPFNVDKEGAPFYIHPKAMIVYKTLAVYLLVFFFKEVATTVEARRKTKELNKALASPISDEAGAAIGEAYKEIVKYGYAVVPPGGGATPNKEALDKGIRLGLNYLIGIARAFNKQLYGVRYAANVMLPYNRVVINGLSASEKTALSARMAPFTDDGGLLEHLAGVLDIDSDLSTSTDVEGTFERDDDLPLLALPLPTPQYAPDSGKPRFLPGAPTAFLEKKDRSCVVPDTLKLSELADNYSIAPDILKRSMPYFQGEQGSLVRSFVSIAITNDRDRDQILGVLNIHCNRPNIFGDSKSFETFKNVIVPILDNLGHSLELRKKAVGDKPRTNEQRGEQHE